MDNFILILSQLLIWLRNILLPFFTKSFSTSLLYLSIDCIVELITFSSRIEPAFIECGFCDWNDAKRKFNDHENSAVHKESILKLTSSLKVDEMLNSNALKTKKTNTTMLEEVIRALKFLARQNLALRGMLGYELALLHLLFYQLSTVACFACLVSLVLVIFYGVPFVK